MGRVASRFMFVALLLMAGIAAASAAPQIHSILVQRGRDTSPEGAVSYHERVYIALVGSTVGAEVGSVAVTGSDGLTYAAWSVTTCCTSEGAVRYEWARWSLPTPPSPHAYEVTVLDNDGGVFVSLVTDKAPPVPDSYPDPLAILVPECNSVVPDTTPTFEWQGGPTGGWYGHWLGVWEPGGSLLWSYGPGWATHAVYDEDHTAAPLTPGYTYEWSLQTTVPLIEEPSDPRVTVADNPHAMGRFTVASQPVVPIEGKLVVFAGAPLGPYYMTGDSDHHVPFPGFYVAPELSPVADQVVYMRVTGYCEDPDDRCLQTEIWRANLDGSGDQLLTAVPGINCVPHWSPDATQVAFSHADPEPGKMPCEAGFHTWIVDADGQNPHEVVIPGAETSMVWDWSADGSRLLISILVGTTWPSATVNTDGSDLEVIVTGRGDGVFSPDGLHIAYTDLMEGVDGGEAGCWRTLNVVQSDGSDPHVVFSRFVSESDLAAGADVYWVGPAKPQWSPYGDRIAFLAALPFDPLGPTTELQLEAWVCDATDGGNLRRLTYDRVAEYSLFWTGANTSPGHPEVTVNNTTVAFSDVTGEGVTTVIRSKDPPAMPTGYQFCGDYYEINTTLPDGSYSLPITICMTYEDEDVPGGNEEALCLLHYNETTEEYEDITTFKDTGANKVCGEADSLSVFGLATMPIFGGFRQPINADGSSVFKAGRTVPVKFALQDSLGNTISDAICRLGTWHVSSEILGSVTETAEAAYADVGDAFRYDDDDDQYIYNLSTKGMATGTWMLRVTADGWPGFEKTVLIGLR